MDIGFFLLLLVFIGLVGWIVFPFIDSKIELKNEADPYKPLLHIKQKLLEEFRDLEFDHQLNKMTSVDFEEQRKIVLEQLQTVYKELDQLSFADGKAGKSD